MFYKILLLVFMTMFIAACSTTPEGTADLSGSGSSSGSSETSGTDSIDPSPGDAAILEDLINTPLGGPSTTVSGSQSQESIEPGSQEDLIVNVGDRVFFDYDSAELDADAQELLQYQAAWFKEHNITSVTIEGHCDERGTREYNLALGEKRAQAVKNYLNGLAVFPVINTLSYGKERPAVVGSNEGAWGQNRRSVTKVN
jgi:peptidoglycan-associated lipoprotein